MLRFTPNHHFSRKAAIKTTTVGKAVLELALPDGLDGSKCAD
jgi:hypothetical protein